MPLLAAAALQAPTAGAAAAAGCRAVGRVPTQARLAPQPRRLRATTRGAPGHRRGAPARVSARLAQKAEKELSLELPSEDVQQAMELIALPQKRGKIVLVAYVDPRSATYAAGVRAGQRVTAVSDPVRAQEVWDLNEMSSLRYVNDAIQGRRAETLQLRVTAEPALDWEALAAVAGVAGEGEEEGGAAGRKARMQALQAAARKLQAQAQEARMAKRDQYISQQEERAPSERGKPFAFAAAALFLLPPLAALSLALGSGYLTAP